MAERTNIPNSPECGLWETLLADALDGLLKPEDAGADLNDDPVERVDVAVDPLGGGRADVENRRTGAEQRSGFRRELEAAIERRGLGCQFRIVENCRDITAAYALADVVVSASTDPEGFGRTIVEAQAMGRPVIATDHGGARETVVPGSTGWLVRSRRR